MVAFAVCSILFVFSLLIGLCKLRAVEECLSLILLVSIFIIVSDFAKRGGVPHRFACCISLQNFTFIARWHS